jgi:hypothetical protein
MKEHIEADLIRFTGLLSSTVDAANFDFLWKDINQAIKQRPLRTDCKQLMAISVG